MNITSQSSAPLLLVTGGSRGIGAATVKLAASRGWAVAINYVSASAAAEALVRELVEAGGEAAAFRADVGDDAQVRALFAAIDAHFGLDPDGRSRLRGLVNNAAVGDLAARVDEMSAERVARIFAVNVIGSFGCAREAVLRMSTRHGGAGGAIVNLSSRAAQRSSPGIYVDYAASKAAIDNFTLGLALEVADEGVRVNGVRPGIIDTDIHAAVGMADRVREMAPTLPMRRAGTVDEIAPAILWLLSDEASYVTGAMLDVAGGR
jgi:NAD(P)-dependent dehydrogenase (short-subunit alcohol dehydrogenase family)